MNFELLCRVAIALQLSEWIFISDEILVGGVVIENDHSGTRFTLPYGDREIRVTVMNGRLMSCIFNKAGILVSVIHEYREHRDVAKHVEVVLALARDYHGPVKSVRKN